MVARAYIIIILFIQFNSCVPITTSSTGSTERPSDIQTIQLFPGPNTPANSLLPPVIRLNSQDYLILKFDDVVDDFDSYYARIKHYDKDWIESTIPYQDYLYEYNEFPLNNYDFSVNTRIGYVHYQFRIPPLKLSGNYTVEIYKNSNNPLFEQRFTVYDPKAVIIVDDMTQNGMINRRSNQQIDFELSYSGLRVRNILNDFTIVMRQNFRWNVSKNDLKPFIINEAESILEYRNIDMENSFEAGNQFRFFDMRSIDYLGQNVRNIDRYEGSIEIDLFPERDRGAMSFVQYEDQNGQSIISTVISREADLYADYFFVNFEFPRKSPVGSELYVVGEITSWYKTPSNMMQWDGNSKKYTYRTLAKQGTHFYAIEGKSNRNVVEGDNFETENDYDIIVYYREPGTFYDQAVAYRSFKLGIFN